MFDDLGLWVWYWNSAYIDVAKRIGARYLLVKAADGADVWKQWPTARDAIRTAGLMAIPWGYSYGALGELDALPIDEKVWVLDPEIEFERLTFSAQSAFVDRLLAMKKAHGLSIGCATWARPEAHPSYDVPNLARAVDTWLPMVAWQSWTPADPLTWFRHWDDCGFAPTVPWVSASGVSATRLVESVTAAQERYGGATIWAAHTLTEDQVTALEAVKEDNVTAEQKKDVLAHLDVLWGIGNDLAAMAAATKSPLQANDAKAVQERVIAIKQTLKLD